MYACSNKGQNPTVRYKFKWNFQNRNNFRYKTVAAKNLINLIICNLNIILENVWFFDKVLETKLLFSLAFIEYSELKF